MLLKPTYDGIYFTVEILDHGEQVRHVHWQSFYVSSKFYVFSYKVMKYEVSPVLVQFIPVGMFCQLKTLGSRLNFRFLKEGELRIDIKTSNSEKRNKP